MLNRPMALLTKDLRQQLRMMSMKSFRQLLHYHSIRYRSIPLRHSRHDLPNAPVIHQIGNHLSKIVGDHNWRDSGLQRECHFQQTQWILRQTHGHGVRNSRA